jgi:transposase
MTPYRDINDEEWQRVAPQLPELRPRSELRGRPLANTRAVLNGVLWVMYSGATWSAMPRRYPSYQTCHRRFKAWHESGALRGIMQELYGESGDELVRMMESRMRIHAGTEQKLAQRQEVRAPGVETSSAANPLSGSPSVFDYADAYRHAA